MLIFLESIDKDVYNIVVNGISCAY